LTGKAGQKASAFEALRWLKITFPTGASSITLPAIYLLTLELKQSKAIPSHFLPGTIASLAAFATLILTTVLAGIFIASPVAGLRPIRAFLFTKTSFPIPLNF